MGWLLYPLPLKRGANAGRSEIRHARRGPSPTDGKERLTAAVMIGIDPHKGSHTATAIDDREAALGQLRLRASAAQAERLVAWAAPWPERTWAAEGAGGLGYLLATGATNKNDPNDARSVAIAALRSAAPWKVVGRGSPGRAQGVVQALP